MPSARTSSKRQSSLPNLTNRRFAEVSASGAGRRPEGHDALTPERLIARYSARIFRHITAVLGPDPDREDLMHEVLVTIILKIHTLREPASLDYWVRQVTSNTLRYEIRRRRIRRHPSTEELPEHQLPGFHSDVEGAVLAERALLVMSKMPPGERVLLADYWFGRDTTNAIASHAGCSTATIRRRLAKARTRFKRLARADPNLSALVRPAQNCEKNCQETVGMKLVRPLSPVPPSA